MEAKLKTIPAAMVEVQVNNDTMKVNSQQTILAACIKDFKKKVPFNCRAGICGACEAKVWNDSTNKFDLVKICYEPVKDGMRVLTLDHEMNMLRQGTADE